MLFFYFILFIYLFIYLSIYLFIYLFIFLSFCEYVKFGAISLLN